MGKPFWEKDFLLTLRLFFVPFFLFRLRFRLDLLAPGPPLGGPEAGRLPQTAFGEAAPAPIEPAEQRARQPQRPGQHGEAVEHQRYRKRPPSRQGWPWAPRSEPPWASWPWGCLSP